MSALSIYNTIVKFDWIGIVSYLPLTIFPLLYLLGLEHNLPFVVDFRPSTLGLFDMDNAVRSLDLHDHLAIFGAVRRGLATHSVHLWLGFERRRITAEERIWRIGLRRIGIEEMEIPVYPFGYTGRVDSDVNNDLKVRSHERFRCDF